MIVSIPQVGSLYEATEVLPFVLVALVMVQLYQGIGYGSH